MEFLVQNKGITANSEIARAKSTGPEVPLLATARSRVTAPTADHPSFAIAVGRFAGITSNKEMTNTHASATME